MQIGRILKLVRDQEYGQIKTDGGDDAHFHKNCLWDVAFGQLAEGQQVEFEIQQTYKGFLAFEIRPHLKGVKMSKGIVKEYDSSRGCGTIVDSQGESLTIYANYISLGKVLKQGQVVEYEIENHRHENWAVNVRIVNEVNLGQQTTE